MGNKLSPLQQKVLNCLPAQPITIRLKLYGRYGDTQQTNAARHTNICLALKKLKDLGLATPIGYPYDMWYRTRKELEP